MLLYNFPQVCGLELAPETVAALSEHPNIIGMKDSSGDVEGVRKIIAAAPKGFQTLVGSASTLFESLELGACGAILALANAFPELCVEIYDASRSGDYKGAHLLAQQLLAPAKILGPQYGIPGLKYALDRLGYYGGPPRPPLLALSEAAKLEIDVMLSNLTAPSAHL